MYVCQKSCINMDLGLDRFFRVIKNCEESCARSGIEKRHKPDTPDTDTDDPDNKDPEPTPNP